MSDTEKYEEICRALVGIDATERYTHEDILSYVYNLIIRLLFKTSFKDISVGSKLISKQLKNKNSKRI